MKIQEQLHISTKRQALFDFFQCCANYAPEKNAIQHAYSRRKGDINMLLLMIKYPDSCTQKFLLLSHINKLKFH